MNTPQHPQAIAPDAPHPASEFAQQLDTILAYTLLMIAAQFRLLEGFTLPIWTRFSRGRMRLARLLAKLAAGTWRPSPPRAPRPDRKPSAQVPYSPRGHIWLIRKAGYHAAAFGSQLSVLFANPNTHALLATAPAEALAAIGRTLRPLCHLLGVELPPVLQRHAPPRRPRPPRSRPTQPRPKPPVIPPWGLPPPEPEPPARTIFTDTAGIEFSFKPA